MNKLSRAGVVLVVMQLHCGGDVARDPGPTTPESSHPYVVAMTNAICEHSARCCNAAGFPADDARCRSFAGGGQEQYVRNELSRGRVYNPDAAATCIAEASVAFARCNFVPNMPVCGRVFVGTAGPGEKCTDAADCAERPDERAYCTDKACSYVPLLRHKESCATGVRGVCEYPLRCVETWCSTRSPLHGGCLEHSYCEDGLYCASGSCAKARGYGEPCDGDPSRCATGSCDAATDTCAMLAYCKR